MQIHYYKGWSDNLQREMEYKTYGHDGRVILVFPSQDQRFYEWEDNGMIDVLAPMIEAGQIRLCCCDSIDIETWSNGVNGEDAEVSDWEKNRYHERIELHERWFNYIVSELIPEVKAAWGNTNDWIVTGCSMGGYHAGNLFFRRPDLFGTLLSFSGLFNADYFFPHYDDALIYQNSPLDFLKGFVEPHLLIEQYRRKQIICCCGQGNYEEITSASNRHLEQTLAGLGVNGWFDFWGSDVNHDFYWWRKQAAYFFGKIFGNDIAALSA